MTDFLAFVDALQRQAADAVSFYPRVALERAIEAGEIAIAFENGDPCAYLWRGPIRPGRDVVVYQAVVHYDVRRRRHAVNLVECIDRAARAAGSTGIRLRCRSSLDANEFWAAIGFDCLAVVPSGSRRSTDVNIWRRPIVPGLFDDFLAVPSTRRVDQAPYFRTYQRSDRD